MATFSDIMRWKAELDTSDVEAGFDRIRNEGEDALDDVSASGEGLTSKLTGLGGKWGKALVAGFAAVGVGALLLQSVETAFARQDALKVVTGRFALTAEEAEKYGDLAGSLYADGWGEGFEEVQQAVALAGEKLKITNEDTLSAITSQVLAVSRTWGVEFDEVIRSTGQLLKNGLAPDAEAALDLVVAAFQGGGNEAGDLLDTIDEYSQHWAAMGLTGSDALNQIVAGFQGGQRDADKLADAVKEMRIRVVEDTDKITDAYSDLGLDADDLRLKFLEGGPAAREAFLEVIAALRSVEDPVERNRLAVELIGTQFEDLGPTALDALGTVQGALEETTGKAKDLVATVRASEWERFKRRGESALAGIGEAMASRANEPLDQINLGLDVVGRQFGWFGREGEKGAAKALGPITASEADAKLAEITARLEEQSAAVVDAGEDTRGFGAALGTLESELRMLRGETVESKDETNDFGAALGTLDWELDQIQRQTAETKSAADEYAEAMAAAEQRAAAMKERHSELKDELSDRRAFLDVESALAAIGDEADLSEDDLIGLRSQVADYIAGLDDIPASTLTEVDTLVKQGEYELALAKLRELEKDRQATVAITTHYRTIGSPGAPAAQPNRAGPRAAGGPTYAGAVHRVTEAGSELLTEGGNTYLLSASNGRVSKLQPGGAGGASFTFNLRVDGNVNGDKHLRQVLDDWGREMASTIQAGRRR